MTQALSCIAPKIQFCIAEFVNLWPRNAMLVPENNHAQIERLMEPICLLSLSAKPLQVCVRGISPGEFSNHLQLLPFVLQLVPPLSLFWIRLNNSCGHTQQQQQQTTSFALIMPNQRLTDLPNEANSLWHVSRVSKCDTVMLHSRVAASDIHPHVFLNNSHVFLEWFSRVFGWLSHVLNDSHVFLNDSHVLLLIPFHVYL